MEELLKHHIHETERRFNEVMWQFDSVQDKLASLNEFKTQALMSARWVSILISAFCGVFTFVATVAATHYMGR